jgi:hypothetical protein
MAEFRRVVVSRAAYGAIDPVRKGLLVQRLAARDRGSPRPGRTSAASILRTRSTSRRGTPCCRGSPPGSRKAPPRTGSSRSSRTQAGDSRRHPRSKAWPSSRRLRSSRTRCPAGTLRLGRRRIPGRRLSPVPQRPRSPRRADRLRPAKSVSFALLSPPEAPMWGERAHQHGVCQLTTPGIRGSDCRAPAQEQRTHCHGWHLCRVTAGAVAVAGLARPGCRSGGNAW